MPALEVRLLAYAVGIGKEREVGFAERGTQLVRLPNVEGPFLGLGLGIQGGVERPVRAGHLAQNELQQPLGDELVVGVPGQGVRLGVDRGELPVVVEHLLEVRDAPVAVGAVAMKAAADVVADAAGRHAVERLDQQPPGVVAGRFVFGLPRPLEQEHQVRRLGKLRLPVVCFAEAEAAVLGVEVLGQRGLQLPHVVGLRLLGQEGSLPDLKLDQLRDSLRLLGDGVTLVGPDLVHRLEHIEEAAAEAALLVRPRRQIGGRRRACASGVRNIESGQPPRPALRQLVIDVQGGHVDLVDVGPLLAIDLDAHEVLVQHLRDLLVHEALALHHVAPVATGIADGEEDQLALLLGLGQRLGAPGIPIDRIVGVQQQVRAGLFGQAVGVLLLGRCLRRLLLGAAASPQRQPQERAERMPGAEA